MEKDHGIFLEVAADKKLPFEEAISSPMLKSTIEKKEELTAPVTIASPFEKNEGCDAPQQIFDLMYFTRRHPYLEILTQKLAVGSKALENFEARSKAQPLNKAEPDFFSNAMKAIGNFILNEDTSVSVPVPEALLEYKTVTTTTVKKKLSTWTFPNQNKNGLIREEIKLDWKTSKPLSDPLTLYEVTNAALSKEINYLIENAIPHANLSLIGPANSEAVEMYLNDVFFSSYSHSNFDILVVPLQKAEYLEKVKGKNAEQKESLLETINTESICYNIIFQRRDFTVLKGDFYKTDVFFCIKTSYPFFTFYARFLSLFLSNTK